jgi:glucoamylase
MNRATIRQSEPAPGWPGIAPTWTSSAKDMVTTALGPSRVWATLGYGIVNEVYWPSAGRPQIRDLGFIVAGRSEWHEVKRAARYQLSLPEPYIPLPRIVHEGEGYRLELEVSPDPLRDAIVIAFRLTGEDLTLYALLAPHLDGSGAAGTTMHAQTVICWPGRIATRFILPAIAAFPARVPAMSDIPTVGKISPVMGKCDGPMAKPWVVMSR